MEITLDLIKSLRGKTGAGINDCKKALEEAAGDIEKAIELLRKKGAAMAVKRADKIANEGAIKSAISEDLKSGVIIEVNCETDFVSKGDEFQKFAEDIAKTALSTGADDTEKVLSSKASNGLTVKENIDSIMGKVGERTELKRVKLVKAEEGFVADYIHFGSKLGALIGLKGTANEDSVKLGKSIAMQVVAMNPQSIDRNGIPAEVIEKEKDIYRTVAKNENKPEKITETIVNNKVERFYQDNCLTEQEYINESGKSIKDLIAEFNKKNGNTIEITSMVRFQLGEENK
ncbi:MAG: elongation factor Ts [Ignavibacteria bacterium]|nr:elongation factor Ts [Ignavibacteria bacterium]MBK7444466.1 elongation factor Ts [Ignavibacteria bacterium]MBK9404923.1 elongation factor Ts [Ignavibacteria bacterium]